MAIEVTKIQNDYLGARLTRASGLIDELASDARDAYDARTHGIPLGPITGLHTMDAVLEGALRSGIHIVHGNTGVGKTAFCLQIACSCKCPALYVTCEVNEKTLAKRVIARIEKIPFGNLLSGCVQPDIFEETAKKALSQVPDLYFLDISKGPLEVLPYTNSDASIHSFAEAAKGDSKHLLIIIDSIHALADSLEKGSSEYERLNLLIGDIQKLSACLDCAVICIAERNRSSQQSGGLNAGAGSRRIEYCAETVIELNKDQDAQNAEGEVNTTLKISKNRSGATRNNILMLFHGAYQQFRENK